MTHKKIKVGILFGGQSAEHEVSQKSTHALFTNIDKNKFSPILIYIDKKGLWRVMPEETFLNNDFSPSAGHSFLPWQMDSINKIDADIYFPMLHGPNGEDGRVQALLELAGKPYVGANSFSSGLAMDKVASKLLFKNAGLIVGDFLFFEANNFDHIKEAIEYLAEKENVIAIIAVTGTAEALDAAREAERWQVPLILITSREGVSLSSEYVFQHFLTPSQQVRAIVSYAVNNMNSAIFSALYPADEYGEEMMKIFREEVARVGGRLEKMVPYGINKTDFTEEINKLTSNQIYLARKTTKKTEPKKKISLDFEALFIPDSYRRVQMVGSQLAFYDVRDVKLMGTSIWNSPYLLKRGAEYLEGAVFADSFFPYTFYREA
ncbi:MAG: ABC transporter substrate-binding protein, partial [Acidobacteria bacterium]|nr:ABC transporter substrate-binding protein [Acidobacteriota bacterium]